MSGTPAAVSGILGRVFGKQAAGAAVAPLEGGITNRNYRVEVSGEAYVVRIGGENTELLGIDRVHEHRASSAAAELGVGPAVVAFLEGERALVTRFVEGQAVTLENVREPGRLGRIVEAIRRYHGGPPFPGRFSPFETVRKYHRLALERGVKMPDTAARALERMAAIEEALGPPERLVPCHNDLLAANFIDDGRRVWILDWEYAGMGDPFFDLGNFAVNQELTPDGCERLLCEYKGAAGARDLARLHLMRLASDLREAWWGFLQAGISKIEFDFLGYGRKHVERLLEAAARPQTARALAEARR